MKKISLLLLILLFIPSVASENYLRFDFQNQNGQPINNVNIRGWICSSEYYDSDIGAWNCDSVLQNLWQGYTLTTNSQMPHNSIILNFPNSNEVSSEAIRFKFYAFHDEYKTWTQTPPIISQLDGPGENYENPYFDSYGIITLDKQEFCSSPVTLSVTNNIKENLPITIQSSANLDSSTSSAIGFTYQEYVPSSARQYFEVETTLSLEIYEYDINTQQNIGSPIHTETNVSRIYYDDTVTVSFQDWTPPDVGHYNVVVTSTVTDPKCSSNIPQSSSQIVQVWEDFPRDECYSLTRNLGTNPSNPAVNDEVTITFEKLSNYANDYEVWDDNYALTPTESEVTLSISGADTDTQNFNLPANTDDNFAQYSIDWTPSQFGQYQLELSVNSNNYACPQDTASNPLYASVYVEDIDQDDDGYGLSEDCNDDNNQIYPGAPEECDGIDNNCDGTPDEICGCVEGSTKPCSELYKGVCAIGTATCVNEKWTGCPLPQKETCLENGDEDCDGYANCDDSECTNIFENHYYICKDTCMVGYYNIDGDISNGCEYQCTPTNNSKEVCDGIDNNCNGETDEGLAETFYLDFDGDGYGGNFQKITCEKPRGYVTETGDCNDEEATAYPGAEEICDGIDNDCDNSKDEGCSCSEGDPITCSNTGVCDGRILYCGTNGIRPQCNFEDIPEYEVSETTCDGLDNDCDGLTDAEDGLGNCCSPGDIKSCKKTCLTGEEIQGRKTCQNYQWSDCNAQCPQPEETVEIITPVSRTYYTDDKKEIAIKYTPDISCIYILNEVTSANSINSGYKLNLEPNDYTLILQCGDSVEGVDFKVKQQQTTKISTEEDNKELVNYFEGQLNNTQKDQAKKTKFNQSLEYGYDAQEDKTIVKNIIETDADSLDYYLELPKCMADHIDKIDFELPAGYDIIEEDPLVVWHFADVDDRVDLSYEVKGQIPPDCIAKVKGMPIGKYLKINKEKPNIINQIIAPLTVIFIVSIIIIYIQRTHHTHLMTEKDYEQLFIQKERRKLLKNIKSMRFKSKQQAETYMKELGLPGEEKEWILDRI